MANQSSHPWRQAENTRTLDAGCKSRTGGAQTGARNPEQATAYAKRLAPRCRLASVSPRHPDRIDTASRIHAVPSSSPHQAKARPSERPAWIWANYCAVTVVVVTAAAAPSSPQKKCSRSGTPICRIAFNHHRAAVDTDAFSCVRHSYDQQRMMTWAAMDAPRTHTADLAAGTAFAGHLNSWHIGTNPDY